MATHNDFGKLGEELATKHLLEQGYTVLEKNWRYLKAEIDVIAKKENTLAVVEVKARATEFFGNPEEFVTKGKRKLLITAADAYVQQKDLDIEVRFDIIAIVKNKQKTQLEHIKDAFVSFE